MRLWGQYAIVLPHMADEAMSTNEGESSVYELAFHINPNLSETEVSKTFENLKKNILDNGGAIITESSPRRVDLAYTISVKGEEGVKDFNQGMFGWIAYEGLSENQKAIEEEVSDEKNIFRHLVIITTKEVVEFAKQREEEARSVARSAAENDDEEGVSDSELDEALESATM